MRATLGQLPTEDDGWAYEIKWDGYRTIAFVEGGKVRLQSSNSIDVSARYPELQPLADELGGQRAILDGELVVLDERGRPRFELIQRKEMDHLEAAYFVFDVLAIDRHDTIGLPYEERRRLLRELLDDGPNWQVPAHRIGDGRALLDATIAQELEGVMAKRLGTQLPPGRPVQGLAQGEEPPAGRRRDRRLLAGHRQPLEHVRVAARRALGRRPAGVRRRRRHRVHPAPAGGAEGPLRRAAHRRLPVRPAAADRLPPWRGVDPPRARRATSS